MPKCVDVGETKLIDSFYPEELYAKLVEENAFTRFTRRKIEFCRMNLQDTSTHLSNVTDVYIPVTFGDNTNVIEENVEKAEGIKNGMVH